MSGALSVFAGSVGLKDLMVRRSQVPVEEPLNGNSSWYVEVTQVFKCFGFANLYYKDGCILGKTAPGKLL